MTRVKVSKNIGSSFGFSVNPNRKKSGRWSARTYNLNREVWACRDGCAFKLKRGRYFFWLVVLLAILDIWHNDGKVIMSIGAIIADRLGAIIDALSSA